MPSPYPGNVPPLQSAPSRSRGTAKETRRHGYAPTLEVGPLGLENPMGTDGFEFVEYAAPDPELLRNLFTKMGFPAVARHKRKDVTLHRQGDINFIINAEPDSFAEQFAATMARAPAPWRSASRTPRPPTPARSSLGATDVKSDVAEGELDIPAIEGIGGSRLYFVDRYGDKGTIYDIDFDFFPDAAEKEASHASPPHLSRPSDPQCEPRADGALGRFLRAALQLPRDPLLRHRGQESPACSPRR